jgi:hypothetical protein
MSEVTFTATPATSMEGVLALTLFSMAALRVSTPRGAGLSVSEGPGLAMAALPIPMCASSATRGRLRISTVVFPRPVPLAGGKSSGSRGARGVERGFS